MGNEFVQRGRNVLLPFKHRVLLRLRKRTFCVDLSPSDVDKRHSLGKAANLFSIFAALSEDLVFYVKTIDNEYRSKKQASRKYFQ